MAKKPKATAERISPTYLAAGKSFTMGLHDVVRAMKMIEKHGELDRFVRAAKRRKACVSVDADTVNFVKDFVVKHRMHAVPVGKHIVNAAIARDPYRPCNFGKRG
jgi:signal transduction histidine kinase